MPFLSIEFGLFFLCFLPVYWLFQKSPKIQNLLLLAAGLSWLGYLNPWFLGTVVAFTAAIAVVAHAMRRSRHRVFWLWTGIVLALCNLIFFKYLDFFRPFLPRAWQDGLMSLVLPLGISYYTFQSIAYLVALYRQRPVAMSWHNLLLHFGFMPTVTSGPIARADDYRSIGGIQAGMAAQIQTVQPRQIIRPALALSLIVLGIAKKWWLAGLLQTEWVDDVFDNPMQYDSITVAAGIYGYTAQLFFDFSGYTDLVIGMAMLLGFRLPENFNMPLRAVNIRDFWNRWHISLSAWIRDHIYIPLGGSQCGWWRTQFNLMAAMVLSGIWHGYGWNFLVWGALHGTALVMLNTADRLAGRREILAQSALGRFFGITATVTFVACCFVVFNTASLEEASMIFQALIRNSHTAVPSLGTVALLAAMALALVFYPLLAKGFVRTVEIMERLPAVLWAVLLTAVLLILLVVAPSGIPGFIYANF